MCFWCQHLVKLCYFVGSVLFFFHCIFGASHSFRGQVSWVLGDAAELCFYRKRNFSTAGLSLRWPFVHFSRVMWPLLFVAYEMQFHCLNLYFGDNAGLVRNKWVFVIYAAIMNFYIFNSLGFEAHCKRGLQVHFEYHGLLYHKLTGIFAFCCHTQAGPTVRPWP